jgi:hypothetical protein
LAFIYISRWDIKPMTFKETAGFMSGKEGFSVELQALRNVFQGNSVAILCDLTRCLRFGDIIAISEDSPPAIIEVKRSKHQNKRVNRQQAETVRLATYLRTSSTTVDGYKVARIDSAIEYIDHCAEFNDLLREATTNGFSYREVEQGLHYYIETQKNEALLQSIIGSLSCLPIAYILSMFRQSNVGYYPFTLSIEDPEFVYKFYNHQIAILILIDPDIVKSKIAAYGFTAEFEKDGEGVLKIIAKRSGSPNHNKQNPGEGIKVGRHFFDRIPFEFISLDWLIGEAIHMLKNYPTDLVIDHPR